MQDPLYPTFTDDGQAPVVFDWPIATANSSAAFPNINYSLIQSQMAQFFPNTAPPGVFEGITESHTYAIGVFYKVRMDLRSDHACMCHSWTSQHLAALTHQDCSRTCAELADDCVR